jgi:hypothetical protein
MGVGERPFHVIQLVKYKVILSLCLIKRYAMKTYGRNGSIAPRIINLFLEEGEWSALQFGRFTSGEKVPENNG